MGSSTFDHNFWMSCVEQSSASSASSVQQQCKIQSAPLGVSSRKSSNLSISYSFGSHICLHLTRGSLGLARGSQSERKEGMRSKGALLWNRADGQTGVPTYILSQTRFTVGDPGSKIRSNAASMDEGRPCNRGADGEQWMQTTASAQISSLEASLQVSPLQKDTEVACVVLLGGFMWMRLFDLLTRRSILGQNVSRKIVHITSGLFYMMSWPFFSSSRWARFIAAIVPLAMSLRLIVHGLSVKKDDGLVRSMSRSGEPRELLEGPLYYAMVLFLSTVLFWRQTPVGIISVAMMCGGDGIADIVGRRIGSKKLPYNAHKSYAGSVAMFLFGFLLSSAFVWYFSSLGFFRLGLYGAALKLTVISLVATIVESLPISSRFDDNVTVPTTTFLFGVLLFRASRGSGGS